MKRRDFLKLAGISIAGSLLGVDFSSIPEEWVLSVDEDVLYDAIDVKGVYPGNGKPYAAVDVDVEKMWSAITVTDAQGTIWYTANGEIWHDKNGVVLNANPD